MGSRSLKYLFANVSLTTATKAGDQQTVLSLMSDDVIFMTPGREPFGKAAFAAGSGSPQDTEFDGRADIKELRILGDWAYLRNYIDLTVRRQGAPDEHHSGYTLSILRKQPDGRWALTRDANLVTPRK